MKTPQFLTQLPEGTRHLLCELAYGWRPSPIELREVERLSYGGADLTECVNQIHIHEGRLVVTLDINKLDVFETFDMDAPVDATLRDGTRVTAEHALKIGRQSGFSKDVGLVLTLTLSMDNWRVYKTLTPLLWVGQVEGMREISFSGNLVLERTRPDFPSAWFPRHFVLLGAYSYYFVQCRNQKPADWYLVVDSHGEDVDLELLGRDFLILEFVLGRQLRLPQLLGVMADQSTVACLPAFDRRQHLQEHSVPPVPIERNNVSPRRAPS